MHDNHVCWQVMYGYMQGDYICMYTCYVYMQVNYVYMQDIYVVMSRRHYCSDVPSGLPYNSQWRQLKTCLPFLDSAFQTMPQKIHAHINIIIPSRLPEEQLVLLPMRVYFSCAWPFLLDVYLPHAYTPPWIFTVDYSVLPRPNPSHLSIQGNIGVFPMATLHCHTIYL